MLPAECNPRPRRLAAVKVSSPCGLVLAAVCHARQAGPLPVPCPLPTNRAHPPLPAGRGRATTSVAEAHRFAVRDLDYNPNKPFCLATCGEDRLIKFWDLRRPNAPVKIIVGHDHW